MTQFKRNTIAKQIELYIKEHPRCLKDSIIKNLGIGRNTVSGTLHRLRADGRVKRTVETVTVDNQSFQVTRWEVGIDDGIVKKDNNEGAPRRKFSKTWEPNTKCDPLVALFFSNHNKENTQDEEALAS